MQHIFASYFLVFLKKCRVDEASREIIKTARFKVSFFFFFSSYGLIVVNLSNHD